MAKDMMLDSFCSKLVKRLSTQVMMFHDVSTELNTIHKTERLNMLKHVETMFDFSSVIRRIRRQVCSLQAWSKRRSKTEGREQR
jgi:hypothetical protein